MQVGHNVHLGYYAQNQAETLSGDDTVFDTIDKAATGDMRMHIRTLLGAFLFGGDASFKKVKVLSGGEKSRLAMCLLLLEPYNLLILDEPTNHLDMRSKDVLKNALKNFDGTVIVVSHDRDFLKGMTNRVFEFRDKKVKEYIGDIYDYLETKKMQSLRELEVQTEAAVKVKKEAATEQKQAFTDKKNQERERNKLQRELERTEKEIAQMESDIKVLEDKMNDPAFYSDKDSTQTFQTYNALKEKYERTMHTWESLQGSLEQLNAS